MSLQKDEERRRQGYFEIFLLVGLLFVVLPYQISLGFQLNSGLLQTAIAAPLVLAALAVGAFLLWRLTFRRQGPTPLAILVCLALLAPSCVCGQRDRFVNHAVDKAGTKALLDGAHQLWVCHQEEVKARKDGETPGVERIAARDPNVPAAVASLHPLYIEFETHGQTPAISLRLGGFGGSWEGITILADGKTSPGPVIWSTFNTAPDPYNEMEGVTSTSRTVAPGIMWRTWEFKT